MTDAAGVRLTEDELKDAWPVLSVQERAEGFRLLDPEQAEEFFLALSPLGQANVISGLARGERRLWMRLLAPDDAADVLQEVPAEDRESLLALLDDPTRREVTALLAYSEDHAGGLMSPRFARVRASMRVDEAIRYLRRQAENQLETIYYAYILDKEQKLLGVVSFRELFTAPGDRPVQEVMHSDVIKVQEDTDQEIVARVIGRHDLMAVPVVDAEGRMKGIITVDDIVDVVQEEATEDMHKLGGLAALDAPYLQTGFLPMLKKRAGWLSVLFVGEMLTESAMGHYQSAIARAVILTIFIPLIISSGGNAGSQASTLVIRAMALGEVRLRDWWRIMAREALSGSVLGVILATIGVIRIVVLQGLFQKYGPHYGLVAITVGVSLVGVVTWGTLAGSMLPFALRKVKLDPASASAPLVATLVDVSGLVIYFSAARVILGDSLL